MSTTSTTAAKAENSIGQVQFLTITALFIALTYVFTAFVNVRLPITANGGLIHLGNVPIRFWSIIGNTNVDAYFKKSFLFNIQ